MPALTGFDDALFLENTVNGGPQLLDADVVFTDVEGDFNGGSLTLSGLLAEDRVSVRNEGSGTGQIGLSGANVTFGGVVIGTLAGGVGATLTITFNAAATSASIDALIQNLTFANISNTPTASRDLVINIIDAAGNDLGTTGAPGFIQRTGAANPMNGVNVGVVSEPALADLDGDGDLDAVVGSGYGVLNYFENTGTTSAAVFTQRTGAANPFDGVDVGNNTTPTFGDLDGDGDLDLVVGEGEGTINYFENTGTTSAPVFVQRTGAANPFNDIDIILSDGISPTIGMVSAPALGDLDGDGDLDALIGEVEGFLRYLENTGTTLAPVFVERTGAANPFNGIDLGILSNPTFVDLDGDGDLDAMIGETDGILNYFENTGTTFAPVFVQRTGAANPFDGVDVGNVSAPAFGDLDGDGDLEALVGTNLRLDYFQNTTIHGQIVNVAVTAEYDAPAGPPILTDFRPSATFAENTVNAMPQLLDNAVVFTDIDGDYDGGTLTLSGLLAEDTVSLRNEGSGTGQIGLSGANVSFGGVIIGTLSGGVGATLAITFNAAATPAAIDALIQNLTYANASDTPTVSRDLLINITDAAGNELGPVGAPSFTERTGVANPFNGVNVGGRMTPSFADLDGDGDLDAVIGEFDGFLNYLENTGTDAVPAFTQRTGAANPFNGFDVGFQSTPVFSDLDGDGDLDVLSGETFGTLRYFENTGTTTAPIFVQRTGAANPFDGVNVGRDSAPTLADLDGDGDLDALVGEGDGILNYFENTGTVSAPVFIARTGPANPFDGLDLGRQTTPTFVDLDGDGDLDALIGERYGALNYFENTGSASTPVFTARTGAANPFDGFDVGYVSAPAFADLDGDGDLDVLSGENNGVLNYFENTMGHGQIITVTVTAENDAPVLIGFPAAVTFGENTVNGAPQLLVGDVTFSDDGGDFDGGSLTLAGLLAEDTVSVRNQGSGAGQIGLSGANISFGGVVIGTLSGGVGATLIITFNAAATPAAIEALIENLTYANSSNAPTTTRDFLINITDASGIDLFGGLALAGRTDAVPKDFEAIEGPGQIITITVTAEDDAPAATGLPTDVTVTEDLASDLDLSSLTLTDPDLAGSISVVLTASAGTMTATSGGSVSVNNSGTGAITLTGTAPAIDAFMNMASAIQYTGTLNANGENAATVTVTADGGSGVVTVGVVNVDITPIIDPPALSDFGHSVTFGEDLVSATPQLLDADVAFTDSDGDYDGGILTLSGLLAEDRASVRSQGASVGQIGLSGANVSFGGVVVGTLAGGVGATLTITFNSAATSAAIDAVIQNLTYGNVSNTPTVSRDLLINITDSAGNDLQTGLAPTFTLRTGVANPFNGVNVGDNSVVALADLDGDGDLDAVIGENGGVLNYFENINQVFTQRTGAANPFGGVAVGFFSAPTLADVDGDGDLDAVVGESDGILNYFENINQVFTQLAGAANPFDGVEVGDNSRPAFVDLDGDGDLDLVVGNQGGVLSYFENTGPISAPLFEQRIGAANPFNALTVGQRSAPDFVDLDGDGDMDVIVGETDGVLNYFENTGSVLNPIFIQQTGAANPFIAFDVGQRSTPAFADVDGDGDVDAVVGERDGFLNYLENTTVRGQTVTVNVVDGPEPPILTDFRPSVAFAENTVNATPQLLDVDVGFTDIDGDYDGGTLTLSGLLAEDRVSVRNEGSGAGQVGLSGANVSYGGVVIGTLAGGVGTTLTITFNAAATSSAIDAVIQNLTYGNVSNSPTVSRDLVINITDEAGNDLGINPTFIQRTGVASPLSGIYGEVSSAPAFADLDRDGDLDAVVGTAYGNLQAFENIGNASAAVFAARTGIFNPFNGLDVGYYATPALADLDNDGDVDAVVGTYDGFLIYLENTSSTATPVFSQQFGLDSPFIGPYNALDITPTFVDLDGDTDLDIAFGKGGSGLYYLENIGDISNPIFIERMAGASPFYTLFTNFAQFGGYTAPTFSDVDGDGDFDAVVGRDSGDLAYFENTGTALAPEFTQRTGAANPFDGVNVGPRSTPTFADIDDDGDLDLVVGENLSSSTVNGDAPLNYFENTMAHGQVITVTVTPQNELLVGTGLADLLNGTFLDEDLFGLDGDDFIQAGGGNDRLRGGLGNDRLSGGDGIDTADYSDATVGVTVNLGLAARSQNTIGAGRDTLSGIENLSGSAFSDTLTGDAGDNVLSDALGGNDRFMGGAGNDSLMVERSDSDGNVGVGSSISLIGGTGNDSMTFDGHGRYTDTVVFEGQDGDDMASTMGALQSNISLGAGNDRVTVDTLGGSWSIKLGSGMDTIALADTGGAFMAGMANIVRDFTAGNGGDVWDFTAYLGGGALPNYVLGSNPFLDGHMRLVQAGRDTLLQVDRDGGGNSFETLATMQNTVVANFTAANFTALGLSLAPLPTPVEGTAGPDSLTGTDGIDVLNGNGADDRLVGGASGDTLNGGAGIDILDGGEGDDFLNGGSGGQGDTATYATASAGVNVNLGVLGLQNTGGSGFDSLTGIEHLVGSAFTDELRGDGFNNRLTDTLGGNDFLRGEGGADNILISRSGGGAATTVRLNGGVGADSLTFTGNGRFSDTVTLEGDADNDTITVSGAGTINIDAGSGNDTVIYDTLGGVHRMTLGSGVDTVRLAGTGGLFQASGDNLVRDFTTGAGGDIVDLTAYLAGGALTNYTGGSNPFADGHMRLVQNGTRTLLQVDRDGGGNGYQTVLAFANTLATSFTAANFNGFAPTGAMSAPLETTDKDADAGPQVWGQETGTKDLMPEVLPTAGDDELGPQVWGQETGPKDAMPEVLPGADDEDLGGIGDARTTPGVFGGGADPWIPLTLDEAGDGFLTVTGGLNPDDGEPLVLPGEQADDLPDLADLFDPFPMDLTGPFAGTVDENGLFLTGSGPGDQGRDGWLF